MDPIFTVSTNGMDLLGSPAASILFNGDCTGEGLVVMFTGCIMEGVTVVFAPLGANLGSATGKTLLH